MSKITVAQLAQTVEQQALLIASLQESLERARGAFREMRREIAELRAAQHGITAPRSTVQVKAQPAWFHIALQQLRTEAGDERATFQREVITERMNQLIAQREAEHAEAQS